jgi:hypothetical protein
VPYLDAVANSAVDEQTKSRTAGGWVPLVDFGPLSVVAGLVFWLYIAWFTTGLLLVGGDSNDQNLPQSGRLLYCVRRGFLGI